MSCCVCCRLVVADRSSPPRRCRLGVPSAAGRVPERPNVADEPAEHSGRQRARCHGHGGLAGGPCGGVRDRPPLPAPALPRGGDRLQRPLRWEHSMTSKRAGGDQVSLDGIGSPALSVPRRRRTFDRSFDEAAVTALQETQPGAPADRPFLRRRDAICLRLQRLGVHYGGAVDLRGPLPRPGDAGRAEDKDRSEHQARRRERRHRAYLTRQGAARRSKNLPASPTTPARAARLLGGGAEERPVGGAGRRRGVERVQVVLLHHQGLGYDRGPCGGSPPSAAASKTLSHSSRARCATLVRPGSGRSLPTGPMW